MAPVPADSVKIRFGQSGSFDGAFAEEPYVIHEACTSAYYDSVLSGDAQAAERTLQMCRETLGPLASTDPHAALDLAGLEFYHAVLFGDVEDILSAQKNLDEKLDAFAADGDDGQGGIMIDLASLFEPETKPLEAQLDDLDEGGESSGGFAEAGLILKRLEDALSAGKIEHARALVLALIKHEVGMME
jgi:hypothetical protein